MKDKETIQKLFYRLSVFAAMVTIGGAYLISTQDTRMLLDQAMDVNQMEQMYNERKPDTLNYERVLSNEEAKLVNTMSDFLDQGMFKAFPHYRKGQSYKEFDQEILTRINQQTELFREAKENNDRLARQASNLRVWGCFAALLFMILGKLAGRFTKVSSNGSPD